MKSGEDGKGVGSPLLLTQTSTHRREQIEELPGLAITEYSAAFVLMIREWWPPGT